MEQTQTTHGWSNKLRIAPIISLAEATPRPPRSSRTSKLANVRQSHRQLGPRDEATTLDVLPKVGGAGLQAVDKRLPLHRLVGHVHKVSFVFSRQPGAMALNKGRRRGKRGDATMAVNNCRQGSKNRRGRLRKQWLLRGAELRCVSRRAHGRGEADGRLRGKRRSTGGAGGQQVSKQSNAEQLPWMTSLAEDWRRNVRGGSAGGGDHVVWVVGDANVKDWRGVGGLTGHSDR